jgi:hypothetical protein
LLNALDAAHGRLENQIGALMRAGRASKNISMPRVSCERIDLEQLPIVGVTLENNISDRVILTHRFVSDINAIVETAADLRVKESGAIY